MLLYISGSYPDNQEGIAAGAKVLLDAMEAVVGKDQLLLLTTDTPIIANHIAQNTNVRYSLLPNWKVRKQNLDAVFQLLDTNPVTAIHMEYPGDLYGKTFLASFLPFFVRCYNRRRGKHITFHVRLHEFTRARFLRKLAILPILWFADTVYVPAQKDREVTGKLGGNVRPTTIGTNILVVDSRLAIDDKKVISYFGSIYPGKGIERMLKLWQQIRAQDSEDQYRFKIIGDIGTEPDNHFCEYHKQVWQWIEQYGLKDAIEVTGYVSDAEVSHEIQHSAIATLPYEDGLTLRRGSFLAYLSHGIPIVTTPGDAEANALFDGHPGVAMVGSDEAMLAAIEKFGAFTTDTRLEIHQDNIALSRNFDWKEIAETFLKDYRILSEQEN